MVGVIRDITVEKQTEKALHEEHAWMKVILEASALASSRLEYAGTFAPVAETLRRLIPVDHFMVILREGAHAVFVVVETRDNESSRIRLETRVPFAGSFLEHMERLGRPYIISDLRARKRFPEDELVLKDGLRACVRLPLYDADRFMGMLALASRRPHAFSETYLPHLESLALQVAHTVANIRRYQQARGEAERLATIVREVHHRIKNNLQGVIGLLSRYREEHPALVPVLNSAVSQLHAVAEVHNLLSQHTEETVHVARLIEGVCRAVAALCPHRLEHRLAPEVAGYVVSASEAVPLALILNELLQNAVNHGYPDGRRGTLRVGLQPRPGGGFQLEVADDGVAPSPRDPSAGMGLALVQALLPPKGARFALTREGGWTVARVEYFYASGVIHDKVQAKTSAANEHAQGGSSAGRR